MTAAQMGVLYIGAALVLLGIAVQVYGKRRCVSACVCVCVCVFTLLCLQMCEYVKVSDYNHDCLVMSLHVYVCVCVCVV